MNKQVLFIVNPNAGKKKLITAGQLTALLPKGYRGNVLFTQRALHATELATEAALNEVDFCFAVGGDGTVNEVANGLLNSKTVMGILPVGSGNGLARHLHLPFNWQANLNLLVHGKIVCIDTLWVNKHLSVNVSGLGFEGQVAADFSKRKSRGLWGYLVTIIKTAFSYPSFEATIHYDGYTHKQTAISIAIANASQYGNNAVIAPEASLSDETGNLVLIQKPSLLQTIAAIPALFQGKIQSKAFIQNIRISKATITCTSVAMHIDGEPYGHTQSIEVEVIPASLRMLIPATLFKY